MNVNFISATSALVRAEAKSGECLLDVAQRYDMPLEGTCEGAMACSTCHVIVDDAWFGKLEPASSDEDDMLDFATGVTRTSRLACQIILSDAHDGLTVRIPAAARNMTQK
jgi:ferredoxin-2, mitochondrial